jgi:ATP-dependent RNA helicase DeaD
VSTTTTDAPEPAGFDTLGLAEPIVKAVLALGYEEATPIQRAAIPVLLEGRDIIGQAGTGTGKTAAFALPLLHRLLEPPATRTRAPRAMILVPTRELAMQVAEAIHKYAKHTRLTVVPVYGGAPMHQQIRALQRGVEVVVATPGRALDHLRRGTLDLTALEVLVLDEADEMLDMGFAEDLEAILTATPATRQTALFAATMAPRISAIAGRHLQKPERITIKAEKRQAGKVPRIRQVAYIVARGQKGPALGRILEFEDPASAIVFCRTRVEVDELTETLKSHGYGAAALHGGLDQRQRDRVMQLFRTGKTDVLVATDVAARGIDIEHVSHVINYDLPTSPEVYVHRIGRTGRIGREGVAITLLGPREQRSLRYIEGLTKQPIEVGVLPTQAALKAKRLDTMRMELTTRIAGGGLDEMRALVQTLVDDFDPIDIAAAALSLADAKSDAPAVSSAEPEGPVQRAGFTVRRDEDGASRGDDAAGREDGARDERPRRGPAPRSEAPPYPDRPPRASERTGPRPAAPRPPERPRPSASSEGPRYSDRGTPSDRPHRAERPARSTRGTEGLGREAVVIALNVGRDHGVRPADLVGAIAGEAGISSKEIGAIRVGADASTVELAAPVATHVAKVMKGKFIRGEKVDVRVIK